MICPECRGKGLANYYPVIARDEFTTTVKKFEDICHTCHGSGRKPQTNADRIRAMSDEELAWELLVWRFDAFAKAKGDEATLPSSQKTIVDWLKQPVKGGEDDG